MEQLVPCVSEVEFLEVVPVKVVDVVPILLYQHVQHSDAVLWFLTGSDYFYRLEPSTDQLIKKII